MIDERSAAKPPTTVPLDDEEGVKRGNEERLAKLIVRLVNGIAEVVNRDPAVRDGLKVVSFPDFNVKNAHFVYPAADLEAAPVLVDFEAYAARQRDVDAARREPARWDRASILNAARMSRFSSDRAIREYAERIWGLSPVKVELET